MKIKKPGKVLLWVCISTICLTVLSFAVFRLLYTHSVEFRDGDLVELYHPASQTKFKVEIASSPQSRSKGLMHRKSMSDDQGMLFAFPDSEFRSFWMKNTYISLDIIFLDENWEVINWYTNTEVLQTNERYTSSKPSKYVIELNSGVSEKIHIEAGQSFIVRQ